MRKFNILCVFSTKLVTNFMTIVYLCINPTKTDTQPAYHTSRN